VLYSSPSARVIPFPSAIIFIFFSTGGRGDFRQAGVEKTRVVRAGSAREMFTQAGFGASARCNRQAPGRNGSRFENQPIATARGS
jgi:hypothetical protein